MRRPPELLQPRADPISRYWLVAGIEHYIVERDGKSTEIRSFVDIREIGVISQRSDPSIEVVAEGIILIGLHREVESANQGEVHGGDSGTREELRKGGRRERERDRADVIDVAFVARRIAK